MKLARKFASALGALWLLLLCIIASGCGHASKGSDPGPPSPGADLPAAHAAGPVPSPAAPPAPNADVNVLTYHHNNARTGEYLSETQLTPSNVNFSNFGKIGFLRVRGLVDAQPLYVANLTVQGAPHKVVFVATEHDLVYAFDADTFAPLWRASVLGAGETTSDNRGCQQVTPEIGITSTPAIDLKAGPHGAIYVVAMSKDGHNHYFQRLHALDLTTGSELPGSPRTIAATFPGTGDASKNGQTSFDPKQYEDRAALLLSNGVVYTTWSSHCDTEPYGSWVIAYDAATLQKAAVINLTPNGTQGAIWMTGDGPAADAAGNVYLLTGNGTFDTSLDSKGFPVLRDFGNAFVKLAMRGGKLAVIDYFTMYNTVEESERDADLGSGGIVLLPDMKDASGKIRHLAVGAGKDRIVYIVDRDAMGKFDANGDHAYQEAAGAIAGMEFATPAYFNGVLYLGAFEDVVRAFPLVNGMLPSSPASRTKTKFVDPGTTPSVSADGTSNAIVWAVENSIPAALHAYKASDLGTELYNSNQAGTRDQFVNNKFIAPVIAEGRVYVGTPTGVAVFGLLNLRDHVMSATRASSS
jgi:outer membrane protein assembly factor BamB